GPRISANVIGSPCRRIIVSNTFCHLPKPCDMGITLVSVHNEHLMPRSVPAVGKFRPLICAQRKRAPAPPIARSDGDGDNLLSFKLGPATGALPALSVVCPR